MNRPATHTRFFIALFCAAAACAAAGCAVDQKAEVEKYRKVLDRDVAPQPPDFLEDQPLSMTHALELANANNEQLALRGEDYVQALIAKNRAVAAFLPTVSMQPNYAVTSDVNIGAVRTPNSGKAFQVPLIGEINLFRGFGDTATVEAAKATIRQRRGLLLDVQSTILLNVAQVYYQILRSERQVEVLVNSLTVQQARLNDINGRFNNGLATPLDVAQSKARADAAAVALVQARNDVANGRSLLARLIGVPAVRGKLSDEFPVPKDPADEPSYETRAAEGREDLRAARAAIEAARHNVDVAFAQYYPSVSLNTAVFLQPDLFTNAVHWNALLVANVPIFTAGIIEADVRAAWSKLRQAALDELGLRRQIAQDVQVSYHNFSSNRDVVAGLLSQVAAASRAYDLARQGYANGLAINLDVLTAQDDLLQAQLQLASAQFDTTVFYLDLLRASGDMTPKNVLTPSPQPNPVAK